MTKLTSGTPDKGLMEIAITIIPAAEHAATKVTRIRSIVIVPKDVLDGLPRLIGSLVTRREKERES